MKLAKVRPEPHDPLFRDEETGEFYWCAEDWATLYGPYKTIEAANEALTEYCEKELGV